MHWLRLQTLVSPRLLQRGLSSMSEGKYSYPYPRPALTVDVALVTEEAPAPQLLLIQRKNDPFRGGWALPGGFVDEGEALDAAAARELAEETSVDAAAVALVQVGAFGDPGRDPRGWTVTAAYAALVPSAAGMGVQAADDAADAKWFPVDALPPLAFDHKLIVRTALRRLARERGQEGPGDREALARALLAAADKLEGPWRQ